jgi:uncharacterized protein YoxC
MDILLQANIFFFIASIATIILAIFAGIALWHISRVAKNIHTASDAIQNEFTNLVGHIAGLRESVAHAIESVISKSKKTINKK